jgi:hypothetical protein
LVAWSNLLLSLWNIFPHFISYLVTLKIYSLPFVVQVANYVVEKLVLEKPLDGGSESTFAMGLSSGQPLSVLDSSSRIGLKAWQKLKPSIEILCNNQASSK